MKKRKGVGVLCVSAALSLTAATVGAQQKPEDIIKYRQSALFVMGQHFGPLAAMAQGKIAFDKDAAARHAAVVEFMSKLPWDRFPAGTEQGGNTKAKPEIWSNPDDFKAKAEKMQSEAAKLAQVARGGDFAALKAQVGETGKSCKACHDEYRNK